jgi:hypothetical protein
VRFVRSLLTVLAPAPLLFLALFLFTGSMRKLVFPTEAEATAASAGDGAPVVMVVFDELTTRSIMNSRGQVDAERFPAFAELARGSTWYRNAAASHAATQHAVPGILTGKQVPQDSLPILQDHPRNLFTLLGGSYDLEVFEPVTRLCPQRLCGNRSFGWDVETLVSDVSVVYLHVLLPDDLAADADLPDVTATWGNFRGDEADERRAGFPARPTVFADFVRTLTPRRRPTLYFLHSLLPHVPYQYLPSGKLYADATFELPGLAANGTWSDNRWLPLQGEQRYLLQLGFADRLVGAMLRKLRESGLYDDALVVVTADHGVAFHPGESRRWASRQQEDIVFVPLFVKLPHQDDGRVVDRTIQSVDILPTIASAIGTRIPWPVDGRPALAGRRSTRVTIRQPFDGTLTLDRASLARRRDAAIRAQLRVFGHGDWKRVYAFGPEAGLVGRRVGDLAVAAAPGIAATLQNSDLFAIVDPDSDFVPAYVQGEITGARARPGQTIAVAVNGSIAAVGRTYHDVGKLRFGVVVPESAFVAGENDVEIFLVTAGRGRAALAPLAGGGARQVLRLARGSGGERLQRPSGEAVRVVPGAVAAYLEVAAVTAGQLHLLGWAGDLERRRPRSAVHVFADGRLVYTLDRPQYPRGNLPDGLRYAGFDLRLPVRLVAPRGDRTEIRVFAVVGDVASEVQYPAGYRWTGR